METKTKAKRFEKLMLIGGVISALGIYFYAILEVPFIPDSIMMSVVCIGIMLMLAPFVIVGIYLAVARYERIFNN